MQPAKILFLTLSACLMASAATGPDASSAPSYNKTAAAGYLDKRENWWLSWPVSQRDHDTACVSCHTALPYALSRPVLRGPGDKTPSSVEQAMLANIIKRVTLWNEVLPFYDDAKYGPHKAVGSRTSEAVLNALILANYDASKGSLSAVTKAAFNNVWAIQLKSGDQTGAWNWLNFENSPWEGLTSQYWGATLVALAAGIAPDNYASDPTIQENLKMLRAYLSSQYSSQPLLNKVVLLWASSKLPGLLTGEQRAGLQETVFGLQKEDGGWSLSSLGTWERHDKTPLETKSDGYATGLTVFALEQAGLPSTQSGVKKGLSWLIKNQDQAEGLWPAYSLNKNRDLSTDTGRLMVDAATAFAVLALESAH